MAAGRQEWLPWFVIDAVVADGPWGRSTPMVDAPLRELEQAPISDKPQRGSPTPARGSSSPGTASPASTASSAGETWLSKRRGGATRLDSGRYAFMRGVLESELSDALYRLRNRTVEPLIGHTSTAGSSIACTDEAQSGVY